MSYITIHGEIPNIGYCPITMHSYTLGLTEKLYGLLIGYCWEILAETHFAWLLTRKNQCLLSDIPRILADLTCAAADIHQSPHSMLCLFNRRKAYDVLRMSSGGGPYSKDYTYGISWLMESSQTTHRSIVGK